MGAGTLLGVYVVFPYKQEELNEEGALGKGCVWVEEGVAFTVPSYDLLLGGTESLHGIDLSEFVQQGPKD